MNAQTSFDASLLLPDIPDGLAVDLLDAMAASLTEAQAHPVLSEADALTLCAGSLRGHLTLDLDHDLGPRVTVTLGDTDTPPDEALVSILGGMILAALERCEADHVIWLGEDVLLERDEFIELRTYVSPRRSGRRAADPVYIDGWDNAEANLARLFRNVPEPEASQRPPSPPCPPASRSVARILFDRIDGMSPDDRHDAAACWAVTGAMGVFVWPVGLALAAHNATRGPDLRLSSQVAALTGLGLSICLTQTGALPGWIQL